MGCTKFVYTPILLAQLKWHDSKNTLLPKLQTKNLLHLSKLSSHLTETTQRNMRHSRMSSIQSSLLHSNWLVDCMFCSWSHELMTSFNRKLSDYCISVQWHTFRHIFRRLFLSFLLFLKFYLQQSATGVHEWCINSTCIEWERALSTLTNSSTLPI